MTSPDTTNTNEVVSFYPYTSVKVMLFSRVGQKTVPYIIMLKMLLHLFIWTK